MTQPLLHARLSQAAHLAQSGQVLQAELLYLDVLKTSPTELQALSELAHLAMLRGDLPRALGFLQQAVHTHPDNPHIAMDFAAILAADQRRPQAITVLENVVAKNATAYAGWLLLGQLQEASGDAAIALRSYYKAVIGAQRSGQWLDPETTPKSLLGPVLHAIERLRVGRRDFLLNSYDELRRDLGASALARVDRALTGYLGEWDASPPDKRQAPKFFYFPDLADTAYYDPYLQPWAKELQSSFEVIRGEALRVWREDQKFQNFVELSPNGKMEDYVGGEGTAPAWEAFFFYRHGMRFDANHARCPQTSAVLESIELCRIEEQAPEICFSVLTPGTHLLPHYGVTNARLVMHLPLLVTGDCALNVIDVGAHYWKEGELMMFDDTFQHEAWNRSGATRIILLMDCWNPHLTPTEKMAMKQLIETITGFQLADRAARLREQVA